MFLFGDFGGFVIHKLYLYRVGVFLFANFGFSQFIVLRARSIKFFSLIFLDEQFKLWFVNIINCLSLTESNASRTCHLPGHIRSLLHLLRFLVPQLALVQPRSH